MSGRVISLAAVRAEREGWVDCKVSFRVYAAGDGTAYFAMETGDVLRGPVEVNEAHLNEKTLAELHEKTGKALAALRGARAAEVPASRRLVLLESLEGA